MRRRWSAPAASTSPSTSSATSTVGKRPHTAVIALPFASARRATTSVAPSVFSGPRRRAVAAGAQQPPLLPEPSRTPRRIRRGGPRGEARRHPVGRHPQRQPAGHDRPPAGRLDLRRSGGRRRRRRDRVFLRRPAELAAAGQAARRSAENYSEERFASAWAAVFAADGSSIRMRFADIELIAVRTRRRDVCTSPWATGCRSCRCSHCGCASS